MTMFEDRLKTDLRKLADVLLGSEPTTGDAAGIPAPAIDDPAPGGVMEPIPLDPRPRWRRPAAAAVAALVIGALGAGVYVRDDPAPTRTEATAASVAADVVPEPEGFGTWTPMAEAPIPARSHAVAAWTGTEVIVWAGSSLDRGFAYADGATYDPATDTWGDLAVPGWGHPGLTSAFDGRWLYVVAKGGGARYDSDAESWVDLPSVEGMYLSATVATDDGVWGLGPVTLVGGEGQVDLAIARYDRDRDRWEYGPVLASSAAVGPLFEDLVQLDQPVLWTGSEIVVWTPDRGGFGFDPVSESWRRIPAPTPTSGQLVDSVAAVTDAGLTVLAQVEGDDETATAVAVQSGDSWTWHHIDLSPGALDEVTLAGAGQWLAVLGPDHPPVTLHVVSGASTVHDTGPLAGLQGASVVWTGTQLVIWGGVGYPTGSVETPATGAIWTPPGA